MNGYVDWHKRTYTDIIAQSIEKILVDIASASIGNLPVNVAAQDLSEMNINVKAQTIERLIIAQSFGTPMYTASGGTIAPGYSKNILDVTGSGTLLAGYLELYGDVKAVDSYILMQLDGNIVAKNYPSTLNDFNITNENMYAFFLMKYDSSTGQNIVSFSRFITWDSEILIQVSAPSTATNNIGYTLELFYAMR